MASYVVAGRKLMQLLPQWRAPLVEQLQQRSGLPLSVGAISGHMDGLTPVFQLNDVRLAAPDGNPAHGVLVRRMTITPDLLMSLLHWGVWLRDLQLSGLQLHFSQDKAGRLHLQGFPPQADSAKNNGLKAFLALLYRPNRLIIDHANIALKLNNFPLLSTHNARLEMTSSGTQHHLALQVAARERPLEVALRMQLDGNAYQLSDVNARAWLNIDGQNIQDWLPTTASDRLQVQKAAGQLAFWLQLTAGKLQQSTLSLDLAKLVLSHGKQQWQARDVQALAAARQTDSGYDMQLHSLDFATTGGHWRSGPVNGWWNGMGGDKSAWALQFADLALGQVTQQLKAWPFALPDAWQAWRDKFSELQPVAKIASLYVAGKQGRVSRVSGRFSQAAVHAVGKIPGVNGLAGWFDGSPDTGVAAIETPKLSLNIPPFYDHALSAAVSGKLRWFHNQAGLLRVETGLLKARNADATGKMVAGATLLPGRQPLVHLLAFVASDQAEQAKRYIPTRKLPDGLANWLTTAIGKGQLSAGRFLFEGAPHIDPSRQQDHTLQMQFQVQQGHLAFLPDWPELTDLSGSVLVDGRLVFGHDLSGKIYNSRFSGGSFRVFDDAPGGVPKLQVNGQVSARSEDITRLLHNSPLAKMLPDELGAWTLSDGTADGQLSLEFGLQPQSGVTPQVTVDARAAGVTLANSQRRLQFNAVTGQVKFDLQKGLDIRQLKGEWLGQPLTGRVHTTNEQVLVNAQAKLPMDALQQWLGADWLTLATGNVAGQVTLALPWRSKQPTSLAVSSNLAGVVIALPAPLGKPSGIKRQLSFTLQDGQRLSVRYGSKPLLQALLHLNGGQLTGGRVQVGPGSVGSAHPDGLEITGHIAQLDITPWVKWFEARRAGGSHSRGGAASATASAQKLPPLQLAIRLGELKMQGFTLHNAAVKAASTQAGSWHVQLASKRLGASAAVPANYQMRGTRPLTLKIDHLNWPASIAAVVDQTANKTAQPAWANLSPQQLPVANVSIQQMVIARNDYGSWSGHIRPLAAGVKVEQLKGHWRHATIAGELTWTQQQAATSSHFKGTIESKNLKALQQSWGVRPLVLSDAASATVDVRWPAMPLSFGYQALQGTAAVTIGKCRLPHMENNNPLLRLLGVLNVGSIARRLRFDFSDLYSKGLSCDSIKGDFGFNGPTLTIKQLHLESPSADVQLAGSTNLNTHQLDATMKVVLPLSSNLYAGCLAGPVACAGVFVFDRLFGNKLEKAAALKYHIGGSWSHPEVKD